MTSRPPQTQSRGVLFVFSMIMLGVAAPTFFVGLPGLAGQVMTRWNFTESQLGMSVFAELLGTAGGALLVAFPLSRAPVRATFIAAIVLSILANLATPLAENLPVYSLLRAVAGISAGALNGIAMRYLSYTSNPEKHMGLLMVGQVLWSVLLLALVVPFIGAHWRVAGSFMMIAAIAASFIPAVLFFGKNEPMAAPGLHDGDVQHTGVYLALFAILALYCGVGVIWTFIEPLGAKAGLSESFITVTLTLANFSSIAVCLLLPRYVGGERLYMATLCALGLCPVSAAAFFLPLTPTVFALATVGFVIGWSAGAMFIYTTIPLYDKVGRHAALSPGFLSVGFGIGSTAGGALIEAGSVLSAIALVTVSCLLAVVLYAMLQKTRKADPLVVAEPRAL